MDIGRIWLNCQVLVELVYIYNINAIQLNNTIVITLRDHFKVYVLGVYRVLILAVQGLVVREV